MADPVTVNRSLATPATGADVGSWGTVLNSNLTIIDTIVGGSTNIVTTGGNILLNSAQLANGNFVVSGTLTSSAVLVFPAIAGWWTVYNATSGPYAVGVVCGSQSNIIFMPPGEITEVQLITNNAYYRNLGRIGSYMDLATTSVPLWIAACTVPPYLNCDGSTFSAATYPVLANMLGGTTLPDQRGRVRVALNQGTGRVTAAVSGVDGDTLKASGGSQASTIAQGYLPAINYSLAGIAGTVNVLSPRADILYQTGGYVTVKSDTSYTVANNPAAGPVSSTGTFTPQGTIGPLGSGVAMPTMNPVTVAGITLIRAG